jgi:hypothetical protein
MGLAGLGLVATRGIGDGPALLQAAVLLLSAIAAWCAARQVLRAKVRTVLLHPGRRADWPAAPGRPGPWPTTLHEQWPVMVLRAQPDGPLIVFWPDTLCASGRRMLRCWARAASDDTPLTPFWMG